MITVKEAVKSGKPYVYFLCYPDGTPFYVGKGTRTREGVEKSCLSRLTLYSRLNRMHPNKLLRKEFVSAMPWTMQKKYSFVRYWVYAPQKSGRGCDSTGKKFKTFDRARKRAIGMGNGAVILKSFYSRCHGEIIGTVHWRVKRRI